VWFVLSSTASARHVSLGGAVDSEYQSHSCPALSSRRGACMSHVFQVPDDLYSEVAAYAAQRGQTPDALLMALVTGEWSY